MNFELDKAKLVLLVVLDAAVVGAALHVHQLALGGGVHLHKTTWSSNGGWRQKDEKNEVRSKRKRNGLVHLDGHEGRVVANLLVDLVPLALRVESVRKIA